MKQNVENELKTIVSQAQFEKLLSFYPHLQFKPQHNFYYVTSDLSTYAFRIRVMEDAKLFTIKHYVDNKVVETEKTFEGNFEDDGDIIATLACLNIYPPFTCYGELLTSRAIYDNGLGELCFDVNIYNGIVDFEIEYEEKIPHDLLTTFKEILQQADIEYLPSFASKYKRCLATIK